MTQQRSQSQPMRPLKSLAILLVAMVGYAGCTDHRISLEEFLLLQDQRSQEVSEQARPTTQPAVVAEARELIRKQFGPYRVGTGDVLEIYITGLDQSSLVPPTRVRVDRNGNIRLPVVGQLSAGDKELQDIENAVREAFVPEVFTDVTVHVAMVDVDSTEVLVHGAVTEPGLIPLRRTDRNLLQAIVSAGGVTEAASGEVTLKRLDRPSEMVTLDLLDPKGVKSALEMDPLGDGDILTVHAAKPNTVMVGGLVMAPSPQPYPPGVDVNVLQALAAAGGLRTDVTPREATLIRRIDGEDVHVKLDLDRIGTGQDPNIMLAAGDVLWVPHTAETRVQEFINRNFFFRAGVSTTANMNYNVTGIDYLNSNARQQGFRGGGGDLQDQFDPFGFLLQNQALQTLVP